MNRRETGAWGEQIAAEFLEAKGWRIAGRNYRCRMGEIDLIAQRGNELAFVEVKLRKDASYGEAREFVTLSKQRKLRAAASYYLMCRPEAQEMRLRFDVIEIYAPLGAEGTVSVRHIEDAFE